MTLNDVELTITAAEAGAAVVRDHYGSPLIRHAKTGTDFATNADVEAEIAIKKVLTSARPRDGFIGEELGATGPAERTWLVDPICGTLNFAVQTSLVAVNVALRVDGAVTVAASTDPFAHETFWTDGHGAHLRHRGRDTRLVPSADSALVDLNLDAPPDEAPRITTVRMLGTPGFARTFRPRVLSTTLALAWVAAGRRAAYITDGDLLDSVHFAAGIALCQAAGCVVTGLHGQPLHTGTGGLIAAANREAHTELLTIIEETRVVR